MSSYLKSSSTTHQHNVVYNRPQQPGQGGSLAHTHVYASSLNQPKVHVRGLKPSILRKPPALREHDNLRTCPINALGNTTYSYGNNSGSSSLNTSRRSSSASTVSVGGGGGMSAQAYTRQLSKNSPAAHTHTPQSMGTLSASSSRNASRNGTPSSSTSRVNFLNKTPSQKAADARRRISQHDVEGACDSFASGISDSAALTNTPAYATTHRSTSTYALTRGHVHAVCVPAAVTEEASARDAPAVTPACTRKGECERKFGTPCGPSVPSSQSTVIVRKASTDESAVYPTPHNSTSPKIVKSTELVSEHTHSYACVRMDEHVHAHGSETCGDTVKGQASVSPTLHDRVRERGGFGYHIGGVYAPKLRPNLTKLAMSYSGRTDTCVNEISDDCEDGTCDMSFGRVTEKAISAVVEIVLRDWDGQNQYTRTSLSVFLRSLCVRMNLDVQCLVSTLVYLHRLKMKYPASRSASCAQRILFMSLLAATKFNHDRPYDNKAWAMVSNFTLHQVNAMELQFLDSLDYVLSIRGKDVDGMLQGLRCQELVLKIDARLDQSELDTELEHITSRLCLAAVLPDLSSVTKEWLRSSVLTVQNIIEGVAQ
ncbi:hypothetical protein SARC_07525 [Sphaeroforma arctica JP610]|uniref:Cyclin N-terminal domain-containing protein n=1 Tax=Sphaeroforma arctica JP610 TaxID=667725 RepID=A0A0L0FW02_9EUKA|nr:hypothetical protein SARC_07525 [Sphaeroforma arctica JP610]KNC80103.1 hypothetical protein SARC_07525 [Sphaeroforma arctica JP610]|eukprot:XP_014154005.1 hypothetical protein SARC_07525 [Sphaeroforma arctica JP610]